MLRSRSTLPAFALLTLAGCGGAASGDNTTGVATEKYSATLAASNVVPATTSTSAGTLTLTASGDSTLAFSLSVTNMTGITQAHLHSAAAGANGSTIVWLLPVNGNSAQSPSVTLDGEISLGDISPSWVRGTPRLAMDSVKALMRLGRIYVDVHSSTFTNGELRGQIAKAP